MVLRVRSHSGEVVRCCKHCRQELRRDGEYTLGVLIAEPYLPLANVSTRVARQFVHLRVIECSYLIDCCNDASVTFEIRLLQRIHCSCTIYYIILYYYKLALSGTLRS